MAEGGNFVVVHGDGERIACQGWRGRGFVWGRGHPSQHAYVLTWDTDSGARRFAAMNGGTVKPISELKAA